jgi:hypothetical protein
MPTKKVTKTKKETKRPKENIFTEQEKRNDKLILKPDTYFKIGKDYSSYFKTKF